MSDTITIPCSVAGCVNDSRPVHGLPFRCDIHASERKVLVIEAASARSPIEADARHYADLRATIATLTAERDAATKRAEAAETERDRMRAVVEAAIARRAAFEAMMSEDDPEKADALEAADCEAIETLRAALDAYRAGQPATSEAERIAAWLIREEADDTSRGRFACFLADQIRAGEWRKS